jgi:hypothetical protein
MKLVSHHVQVPDPFLLCYLLFFIKLFTFNREVCDCVCPISHPQVEVAYNI